VPRGSQWSILGHRFTPEMVPDEAAIKGQIERIQEEVLQQFGVTPGSVFVLLENVPWSRLNQVSSLYEKCALHFRLFVVTTDDTTEDADELESWSPPFESIMRYPLKDEDVLTYVQHRVSRYRVDPAPPPIASCADLRTFPFPTTSWTRDWVANKHLRAVNRKLSKLVDTYYREWPGDADANSLSADELRAKLIP
jgi:hypothetical protein